MESRAHPNRLGIRGWVGGGRWGFERYLYTLHRLTGLGLLAYFLMHIFVTSARVFGPEALGAGDGASSRARSSRSASTWSSPPSPSTPSTAIRLALIELGFAVGRPIEPVYPYATSVGRQRPLAHGGDDDRRACVALWGGYNFFFLD